MLPRKYNFFLLIPREASWKYLKITTSKAERLSQSASSIIIKINRAHRFAPGYVPMAINRCLGAYPSGMTGMCLDAKVLRAPRKIRSVLASGHQQSII